MIEIVVAPEESKDKLWELFLEYCEDLKQYDGETRPHWSRHYPEFDLYWEESARVAFMAVYDHEPVGFCLLRDTGISYEIKEFYVRPIHRRRGFGHQLVEHVKDHCRKLGRHKTVSAAVYVNNLPAVAFWQSVGFADTGRRSRLKNLRMIETEADLSEVRPRVRT